MGFILIQSIIQNSNIFSNWIKELYIEISNFGLFGIVLVNRQWNLPLLEEGKFFYKGKVIKLAIIFLVTCTLTFEYKKLESDNSSKDLNSSTHQNKIENIKTYLYL